MSTIVINGMSISSNNGNMIMTNGKIFIDGKDVTPDAKEIHVTVTGNIENLEIGACNDLQITGDVGSVKSGSGDIEIYGIVAGDVKAGSGNIHCGNVGGSVKTGSGNIRKN